MQLPRFKFTWLSTVEMMIVIVLVPIVWKTWTKTISNMKYYLELEKMLGYVAVSQEMEIEGSLKKLEKYRADDPTVLMYRAQALIKENKFNEAREVYKTISGTTFEYMPISKIGMVVCDLYELDYDNNAVSAMAKLNELEKKAQSIYEENKDFAETSILLGQIFFKKFLLSQKNSSIDTIALEQARQKFTQVLLKNQEIFATNDPDADYLERFERCTPPSTDACLSLYTGLANIYYLKAKQILDKYKSVGITNSKESQEIVSNFKLAIQYLRSAIFLRPSKHNYCQSIGNLYETLLSYPGIETSERLKLIASAEQYIKEIENYKTYLNRASLNNRMENENLNAGFFQLNYGMGVSFFYMGDWNNAGECFSKALYNNPNTAHIHHALMQVRLAKIDRDFLEANNFISFNDTGRTIEFFEKAVAGLPKGQKLTTSQFVNLNNYAVLLFLQGIANHTPNDLKNGYAILESYLSWLPENYLNAGVQEDPILPKQLARHNLYLIAKKIDRQKAAKMESLLLHRLDKKEK